MEHSFILENAKERCRLRTLVDRLSDEELSLPLDNNWTIAVALAHLSFWDQRSLFLLRKWKKTGIEPSPIDIDIINDSLLSLWLSIPPKSAAKLAISSAEAVDRELEDSSPEFISAVENIGEKFRLYRSIHRKMHLDQIEEVLKKK